MSVPKLVQQFYDRIWNAGDLEAVGDLLSDDFLFRGSLGSESKGREDFTDDVRSVRVLSPLKPTSGDLAATFALKHVFGSLLSTA
jgi:hypothetical protein